MFRVLEINYILVSLVEILHQVKIVLDIFLNVNQNQLQMN